MTRKDLEQYYDIVVRLKQLTSGVVADTVIGSSDDYPYTSHPISIHGLRKDTKTLREIDLLTQQKNEIDSFIDGLEDVRAKTLLDMHYRKGKRWAAVAHETGRSLEANKKYLKRFFESIQTSPRVLL